MQRARFVCHQFEHRRARVVLVLCDGIVPNVSTFFLKTFIFTDNLHVHKYLTREPHAIVYLGT